MESQAQQSFLVAIIIHPTGNIQKQGLVGNRGIIGKDIDPTRLLNDKESVRAVIRRLHI